jgi:phosphatidylserine/phosphatidylglycerophosphate/cardiolipin synthase-like enzyme
MRSLTISLFCLLLCAHSPSAHAQQSTQAAFSPSPEAVQLIQDTISHAKKSIDVAAYSFTSYKIADALIDAHRRGVNVRVLLDKGQRKRHYRAIADMQDAGVPVRFNSHYAIMHDKYTIVDGKTVETGSFNYTASAEKRNAENVIVVSNDPALAKQYLENWGRLWDEGEEYK